jgi:hypothetical protein
VHQAVSKSDPNPQCNAGHPNFYELFQEFYRIDLAEFF